ncbi:hypothetical protein DA01_08130 [Dehalococcoides mccartyi]|uniref:Uncharacterized protein n=2 Tax=Dehalococcoides mccartyi TaxID=61435 RepID=A0A0V8LXA1_9CHLR|nr:hypothetical protein DA01_08130 [Dehalococcoides mccartyi]
MKIIQGFRASHRWMITSGLLSIFILALVLAGQIFEGIFTFTLFIFSFLRSLNLAAIEQDKKTGFLSLFLGSHWMSFTTGAVITAMITAFKRGDLWSGVFLIGAMVTLLWITSLYINDEQTGQEAEAKND